MIALHRKAPPCRSPALHSDVQGVHGTKGATGWKALYTRRDLRSQTEAVEWALLPPSAVSGEHRHTRTEEIYLILNGEGEYYLNGESYPVKSGSLALMTPGNTHGLRNIGKDPLDWWVIETLTPHTQAVLANCKPPRSSPMSPQIADLTITPRVETSGIFDGPLSAVERHVSAPGSEVSIQNEGHETAGFLNRGSAMLECSGLQRFLNAPISFLIPIGEEAKLKANSEIEVFTVSLRVPRHDHYPD